MIQRVAVIYNPFSEASAERSLHAAAWLRGRGIMTWRGVSQEARDNPSAINDADLMVAMGGDGTVLRAARLCFPLDLPLLPVALGHLSFMAEVQPDEIFDGLERIIQGGGGTTSAPSSVPCSTVMGRRSPISRHSTRWYFRAAM